MASQRSSILKVPKVLPREPLQDLNQLLPYNDDEETTTITGLSKRRVSFASMNKVKEFESAAECVTLLNTPAYDERFSSISSDSCHSSVLSLSHTDPQKVIMREASAREDLAVEEEIELTETVGGRIYESEIKSTVDSTTEYTAPCYSNLSQPEKTVLCEIPNQERTDCETSCMETTEVITNNMFSEALISQTCTDAEYEEKAVSSECHDMEISPYREVLPVSRNSIFHRDQQAPARKSIFDLPTPQPGLHFRDNEANGYLATNRSPNEDMILMDTSLLPVVQNEENLPSRISNSIIQKANYGPKRSIFEQSAPNPVNLQTINCPPLNMNKMSCHYIQTEGSAAHNLSSPVLSQTVRNYSPYHNLSVQQLPTNQTKYNNSSMQIVSQEIETRMEAKFDSQRSLKQNEDTDGSCLPGANHSKTHIVSDFQSGCPGEGEIGNKTCYDNSAMQSVSQVVTAMVDYETVNKTRYNNSNMQLASQEENAMDAFGIANKTGQFADAHKRTTMVDCETVNKTCCNNSNMQLASQEENAMNAFGTANKTGQFTDGHKMINKTCSEESNIKSTNHEENSVGSCEISDETLDNNLNPQAVDLEKDVTTEFQNFIISEGSVDDHKKNEVDAIQKHVNEDENMRPTNLVTSNCTLINEVDKGLETEDVESSQLNLPEEKKSVLVDCKEDAIESESGAQKLSCESNSSGTINDSNSPLTVGVNFSIFQKNKETRVEFSGTIDSNKRARSKSISNVQVNIMNNKVKKEDQSIQKLRFSMPASKPKFDETKPRVYASFIDVDVASNQKEETNLSILSNKSLELVNLQSPDLQNELPVPHENLKQLSEENREQPCAKKRLSSEMLYGKDDEEIGSCKRRSISTLQSCEIVTEIIARDEKNSSPVEKPIINSSIQEVHTSTHMKERRESIVYGNQSAFIATENVFVERCSKIQTSICINNANEYREMIEETPAPSASLPESPNTPKFSNADDEPPLEEGKNFKVETPTETTVDEMCLRKSFVTTNFSSKSSLSDVELPMKDRSEELRSDNESERWQAQGHSTPCHKRSIKSMGSHSALEDDLIDSLNNPSIVVHIGDSFSHRSLDSGSGCVSTLEAREGSSGDSGANVNCIETVPSNDVSKVNFVSDWLQNKTGKTEKLTSLFENHSSLSNKVLTVEKSIRNNLSKLPKGTMENKNEDVKTNGGEVLSSETGVASSTGMCQEIEGGSLEDRSKDGEQMLEETEKASCIAVIKSDDVPCVLDVVNSAVDEIIFEKQNSLNLATTATTTDQTILLLQNEVVLDEPESERKDEDDGVEPVDNALTEERGCLNRTDCEEEINLDLMDISADNIDGAIEEKIDTDARLGFETLKNEEAVENTKKKILEKIREEYISDNSDWRTKSVTSDEWIFQLSELRGLGWSLCLPLDVTVKIMPALVVKIKPGSTTCTASFKFINGPLPNRYCEVMEIGIRMLKQKCHEKIKTICRTVEDVPCLLKSLVEDVTWMIKFSKDLKRIGGLEDIQYNNGKASVNVASYKNLILFRVYVDLNNLKTLSVNDVKVEQQIGKIDINCVLKMFSESGRDYDFLSKFVKKLKSTFGC